jgi:hypothetical protein
MKTVDFKRILRTLTDDIDAKLKLAKEDSLYNFFIENFTLTGIIAEDKENVNFQKFRQVYESYKMNIYDLLDLMTGHY